MTAGHFITDALFLERRVSVKPAKLLVLPIIWLPSWFSSTHRRPTKS